MNWRSGFGLIPGPAKILAVLAFVVFFFGVLGEHRASGLRTLIGLAGGTLAGAYFLLAGYVYADAVRRRMPPIPWTALAVLIPNCVGFALTSCCESRSSIRVPVAGTELHQMPRSVPAVANRK